MQDPSCRTRPLAAMCAAALFGLTLATGDVQAQATTGNLDLTSGSLAFSSRVSPLYVDQGRDVFLERYLVTTANGAPVVFMTSSLTNTAGPDGAGDIDFIDISVYVRLPGELSFRPLSGDPVETWAVPDGAYLLRPAGSTTFYLTVRGYMTPGAVYTGTMSVTLASVVPEPAPVALLLAGFGGLAGWLRMRGTSSITAAARCQGQVPLSPKSAA